MPSGKLGLHHEFTPTELEKGVVPRTTQEYDQACHRFMFPVDDEHVAACKLCNWESVHDFLFWLCFGKPYLT